MSCCFLRQCRKPQDGFALCPILTGTHALFIQQIFIKRYCQVYPSSDSHSLVWQQRCHYSENTWGIPVFKNDPYYLWGKLESYPNHDIFDRKYNFLNYAANIATKKNVGGKQYQSLCITGWKPTKRKNESSLCLPFPLKSPQSEDEMKRRRWNNNYGKNPNLAWISRVIQESSLKGPLNFLQSTRIGCMVR